MPLNATQARNLRAQTLKRAVAAGQTGSQARATATKAVVGVHRARPLGTKR